MNLKILGLSALVSLVCCQERQQNLVDNIVWRNGYYLDIQGEDYDYFVWNDKVEYNRFIFIQLSTEPSNILLKTIEENGKCHVMEWRLILPCEILLNPDAEGNLDRENAQISKLEKKHFPKYLHDELDKMTDTQIAAYGISREEADLLLKK